jgi:glyoxylase-like metal-dependent hydrolase (beta-lactamase superfamily II)
MAAVHRLTRRTFLSELGHGVIAIAVLGPVAAACSTSGGATSTTNGATTTAGGATSTTGAGATTTSAPPGDDPSLVLQRVNLGFVSAYVLARGTAAAIVDTGVEGSEGEIELGLAAIGLGWDQVGHVILTHLHPDHIGSATAVMDAAAQAIGYAGAADIPSITSPRPLTAVGDGDTVFDLDVIETPGHTPGHISILDPAASILIAGDALNGADDGVAGPNPQFSSDHAQAIESAKKLASLVYDTAVFGHGEPVTGGASDVVAAMAANL